MRRFNPDRELKRIQHGNRNKILYGIIALLLIISIGSTYALYQVRYSKRIIYTKVAPFSNQDIELAVYVGDTKSDKFPERNSEYVYNYAECDGDSEIDFNYAKWQLDVHANGPDKCNVHFKKAYKDESGANSPELYRGLIPIRYEDNEMYIADITTDKWYDYDAREWANAVLIDHTNNDIVNKFYTEGELNTGTKIEESDILQMYVWIPRYKYQLFNVDGTHINQREIKIQFENGIFSTGTAECEIETSGKESCINATNDQWYTHPAFTFGSTELSGIWVGKFVSGGAAEDVLIKPNITILSGQSESTIRAIESKLKYNFNKEEIDTHMMKNIEWGVMAYLTQSKYGRCDDGSCTEVTTNGSSVTGYGNGNSWNTTIGQLASTTGNIYGVYDMNGAGWVTTMGGIVNSNGVNNKYYDSYDSQAWHLGDATRETNGWYNDKIEYIDNSYPLYARGAGGIFSFARSFAGSRYNCYIVLTAQDGNE